MKVYNYDELKDSRVLYEKRPPLFMSAVILCVAVSIITFVILSLGFKKSYIVKARGNIVSSAKKCIMTSVSGEIVECKVIEGSKVSFGDSVITLKSPEVKIKKVELSERIDALQERKNNLKKLEVAIKTLNNSFNKKNSHEIEFYNKFESMRSEILEYEFISEGLNSDAHKDQEKDQLLKTAKAKIDKIKNKYLDEIFTELSKILEQEKSYKIQLNSVGIAEEEYIVKAPMDGVLHLLSPLDEGLMLKAGTNIATIADDKNFCVNAFIRSSDRAKVDYGQDTKIVIDGFPKSEYGVLSGKIDKIDSDATIDEKTGSILFKVSVTPDNTVLKNKNGKTFFLVSGLSAEVDIEYNDICYFDYFRQLIGI